MRLVATEYISLDGVFEEPGRWSGPFFNDEAAQFKWNELQASEALLLGRKTYETIVPFWPPMSPEEDRFATPMNTLPKIVFSQSLSGVTRGKWHNATLVKDDPAQAIAKLKQQEGKNLLIFGSGKLISTPAQADLIDDYWLQVHPIVLGRGVSLFRDLEQRLDLSLLEVKPSEEGILILHYQPARKAG